MESLGSQELKGAHPHQLVLVLRKLAAEKEKSLILSERALSAQSADFDFALFFTEN